MNWFVKFITSSIGKKLIMSLTGLFLVIFLIVHLIGNLQLLKDDSGVSFNNYAHFMGHNPLIEAVSIGLYFFILLHAVQGLILAYQNRKARGTQKYSVTYAKNKSWASSNMALLGTLLLFFILVHMGDFWYNYKIAKTIPEIEIDQVMMGDLYARVKASFSQPIIIAFYTLSMIVLYFHLQHGFKSAFQTLGLSSKKYMPLINFIGQIYAIAVPIGFAIIPLYFYFFLKG